MSYARTGTVATGQRLHPTRVEGDPTRRGGGWKRQVLIFLTAYVVYELARWLTTGSEHVATANAYRILHMETDLGVDVESKVQDALVDLPVMTLLNYVYLAAQLVVVPLTLVWLYRNRRRAYYVVRNGIIGTWLISVPVYALFPVAPPRLADIGISDTVSMHSGVALDSNFSTIFYNALAAVPSLHAGFAFSLGIAAAIVIRHRLAKVVALLWGPLVTLAVIATGNHYLFDVAAGIVASAAGFAVGSLALRLSQDEAEPLPGLTPQPGRA